MQAILNISLKDIKSNWVALNNASNGKAAAVIKANAYGVGMIKVAKTLMKAGCNYFYVANLDEGIQLREELKTKEIKIAIFEGFLKGSEQSYVKYKLTPIINNLDQLIRLKKLISQGYKIKSILNIDTGMNRLGFKEEEIIDAYKQLQAKTKKIVLMSHFSSAAGTKSSKINSKKQIDSFNKIEKKLNKMGFKPLLSLCNSGGLLNYKSSHKDIVRPGVSLYGIDQKEIGNKIDLENVLTFKTKPISIKKVQKGDKVGYDGKWIANKDSTIAILPVGYADGYPLLMGNNGYVLINGKRAKVVGKVSMDLTAIDISKIKDVNYESDVILWGKDLPIEKIAQATKNIPYTIMTSLSARVKRIYL